MTVRDLPTRGKSVMRETRVVRSEEIEKELRKLRATKHLNLPRREPNQTSMLTALARLSRQRGLKRRFIRIV